MPQAVLGNPHPPWQPIGERDVKHVLDEIDARGPRLIALRAGEELRRSLASTGLMAAVITLGLARTGMQTEDP